MEEEHKCIFPMVGNGVQIDLVLDDHAKLAAFVVSIEATEDVHIFATTLEGMLHIRQHIDECIEYLMKEKEIRESN